MPQWVLQCPSCNNEFTHSKVEKVTIEGACFGEKKPQFPDGSSLECPHCHTANTYQCYQLKYRGEGDG